MENESIKYVKDRIDTSDWLDYSKLYSLETTDRESLEPDKLCTYGLKCLDDSLFKISKNDLVVIGADTGSGKSELALSIAQENALKGKTVGVYYLEGGFIEAMRRIKWREMTKLYYNKVYKYREFQDRILKDISYNKWVNNALGDNLYLCDIENEVKNNTDPLFKEKLYFYPSADDFTLDKFLLSLRDFEEWISKKLYLDLIVIDHLQYFSLASGENEIGEITKILREVKRITEWYNVPIILVSHLRKRGKKAGIPTHEDFYGSGNIAKIASTAILLSSSADSDYSSNIYPTWIRVAKSRVGIPQSYAFLTNFDLKTRTYSNDYEIYKVNAEGFPADTPLAEYQKPKWARG